MNPPAFPHSSGLHRGFISPSWFIFWQMWMLLFSWKKSNQKFKATPASLLRWKTTLSSANVGGGVANQVQPWSFDYFWIKPKVGLIFSNDESHYESEKQSGFINLFIINQYLQGVMNAWTQFGDSTTKARVTFWLFIESLPIWTGQSPGNLSVRCLSVYLRLRSGWIV